MEHTITTCYRWYIVPNTPNELIKVYCIEGVPFSFDYLPEIAKNDPVIFSEANQKMGIKVDQMVKWSDYLIAEEAHPLLFEMKIKNPQELPVE
jgi:DNA-directed RNA polymerase subunit H (RpoH/RPB5)